MVLISLRGPVEAVLTDPAGHRLGVDPRTQQRYEEIDGAQYYPDQNNYRTFLLSEPQLGATYRLDLYATGTGSYELMCLFGDMQGQTFLPVPQGKVSAGQHIQQTITVPLRSQDVPQPPDVFRMQVPDVALIGQPVSMSAEVDEPNPGDSTSLSWDFGDGSQMTGTLTPTHSFAAAGTYTITLYATDSIGFFGHSSRQIEVLSSSTLGVAIRHRAILYEGDTVWLDAFGVDATGQALSYAWDLDENGSFEASGRSVPYDMHGIQAPATRVVRVQVTNASGATAIAQTTLVIHPISTP